MKKGLYLQLMILFAATALLCLAGCAKKETVMESSTERQKEVKQETPAPAPPTEVKPAPPVETAKPEPQQTPVAVEALKSLEDIHFDFDQDVLRPEDRKILDAHADWLMKNPDAKVTVEGNCDERGTEEYNLALGQRRADAAKKYLMDLGIDANRISTISYGEYRPVDPGHNEEAWAKNRNDHFVLGK